MSWVEDFVQKNIKKEITSETTKLYMINIIPLLTEMINRADPEPGNFKIELVQYTQSGIKEIRIAFLKEKDQNERNGQKNSQDVSEENGTTGQ